MGRGHRGKQAEHRQNKPKKKRQGAVTHERKEAARKGKAARYQKRRNDHEQQIDALVALGASLTSK